MDIQRLVNKYNLKQMKLSRPHLYEFHDDAFVVFDGYVGNLSDMRKIEISEYKSFFVFQIFFDEGVYGYSSAESCGGFFSAEPYQFVFADNLSSDIIKNWLIKREFNKLVDDAL